MQGESETLEFKTTTALLKAAFATICAFLNQKGGTVLIGVKDDGKVIGQIANDKTKLEIANEIKKIEPAAHIDIDYITTKDNLCVIAIHTKKGEHAPYIYDGRPFHRIQSATDKMPQHRYEQLLVQRGQLNHSWEDAIAENYSINDLDHDEIMRAVNDAVRARRIPAMALKDDISKILTKLKLMEHGKLKRATVVLFAKEMETGFLQCWLKMARFRGIEKGTNFIDNQQIYCNAFRMLDEADNFFKKHLPVAGHLEPGKFQRTDTLPAPTNALREAMINAICHRDYQDYAGYVSIAIYDDRIEIWSNGTLPPGISIKDLKKKHPSVLRNKIISGVFYLRAFIESWGSGIQTMINSCKAQGSPAPQFSESTHGIMVTFKFAEPIGAIKTDKNIELSVRQNEILTMLKEHPLNSVKIAERLTNSVSVRLIQKDLAVLESAGLIHRSGKARAVLFSVVK